MIEILSPAPATSNLARLLGETENHVRGLMLGCAGLALLAALGWLSLQWMPMTQGNPGSAEVVDGLMALAALLFAGVAAGLRTLGTMASPMRIESLLA